MSEEPALERVLRITQERGDIYGDFLTNHERIALGFTAIFGVPVTPRQAILAMDWVKTCRLIQSPDHQDSIDDKLGYTHGYDEIGRSERYNETQAAPRCVNT
jgi:hypothetical protein